MISKLLNNISTFINYVVLFIILLILTYIIYKIFIIDNDIYIINEKINQIEMDMTTIPPSSSQELPKKQMFEMADFCMNKCFVEELAPTSIDIDNTNDIPKKNLNDKIEDFTTIINEKPTNEIFDLKKEIVKIEDDTSSIVSTNNLNKKKLLKLNLEKLKDKCMEMKLSTEGTKAQLIDRIMEELNKET